MLQKLNRQRSVALALISNSVFDTVVQEGCMNIYTYFEVYIWAFSPK